MHKLVRGPEPACLRRYRDSGITWDDKSNDKASVHEALQEMQGYFCAYCEASIVNHDNRHIEHFRKRQRFPQKTFEWGNLFWSCSNSCSCGRYKDSGAAGGYSSHDLIKPDEDDPEDFFLFLATGKIEVRAGLPSDMLRKAEETLRVFNLNGMNSGLVSRRRNAVKGYRDSLYGMLQGEMLNNSDERAGFIDLLLESARNSEFFTAIKHALTLQGEAT